MSDTKKLRIGFIGCGSHASMCIYATLRMGDATAFSNFRLPVELVAVADKREERARYGARAFGAERWYTDHAELLKKERDNLDAIFIVAGGHLHYQLCLDALAAGLPVFCEKPPALNSSESMRLIEASRKAGKPLMNAFMKRFATAYRMARKTSRSAEFGPITFINAEMGGWGAYGGPGDFERDFLIHHADLIHFLGGDVAELTAYDIRPPEHAGYAIAVRYTSGAIGTMQFHSFFGAGDRNESIKICGTGKHCSVENLTSFKYYRGADGSWGRIDQTLDLERDALSWEPNWTMPRDDNSSLFHLGYAGEVAHFVTSILDGTPLETDIVDGHKALVFLEAMAASKGKPVKINYGV